MPTLHVVCTFWICDILTVIHQSLKLVYCIYRAQNTPKLGEFLGRLLFSLASQCPLCKRSLDVALRIKYSLGWLVNTEASMINTFHVMTDFIEKPISKDAVKPR